MSRRTLAWCVFSTIFLCGMVSGACLVVAFYVICDLHS
jgi:hypothetical protein